MRNKWIKRGLTTGFVMLLGGIALATAGLATNGLEQLKAAHAPLVIDRTFEQITSIETDVFIDDVTIEPSADDKVHVHYQVSEHTDSPITIDTKNHVLTLTTATQNKIVLSPLTIIGEILHRNDDGLHHLIIQVPKDQVLDSVISGTSSNQLTTISNSQVKTLKLYGNVILDHVKAEQADLTNYYGQVTTTNSHFGQLTLTGQNTTAQFIDSTITNSNTKLFLGQLTLQGTTLKGQHQIEVLGTNLTLYLTEQQLTDTSIAVKRETITPPENVEYNPGDVVYDSEGKMIIGGGTKVDYKIHPSIAKDGTLTDQDNFTRPVKEAKNNLNITLDGSSQLVLNPMSELN